MTSGVRGGMRMVKMGEELTVAGLKAETLEELARLKQMAVRCLERQFKQNVDGLAVGTGGDWKDGSKLAKVQARVAWELAQGKLALDVLKLVKVWPAAVVGRGPGRPRKAVEGEATDAEAEPSNAEGIRELLSSFE